MDFRVWIECPHSQPASIRALIWRVPLMFYWVLALVFCGAEAENYVFNVGRLFKEIGLRRRLMQSGREGRGVPV